MDIIVNTQGLSVVVKTTLHAKEKIYFFSFLKWPRASLHHLACQIDLGISINMPLFVSGTPGVPDAKDCLYLLPLCSKQGPVSKASQ